MLVRIEEFGGIAPRLSAQRLPPGMAQIASNVMVEGSGLEPVRANSEVVAPNGSFGTNTQSIFRTKTGHWFSQDTDTDFVPSPIAQDLHDRYYWSSPGAAPQMSDILTATSSPDFPYASYTLGVPRPAAGISSVVSGTASDGATAQERAYAWSLVTYYGEEGPPTVAASSEIVLVAEGETCTVTMAAAPSGLYRFASRRIYRTDPNGTFRFVADIPFGTTVYADSKLDEDLGEAAPSEDWEAPPDLEAAAHPDGPGRGMVLHPSGFTCMFAGRTLYFSELNLPHAYPERFQRVVDYPVVGLAATADGIVVMTTAKTYLAIGVDPASMSIREISGTIGCSSKRSIAVSGNQVMFASPDGIAIVSGGQVTVATEPLFTRTQWQAYSPGSMHGYYWEGRYLVFYDTGVVSGAILFDPLGGENSLFQLPFYAQCGFTDLETDELYLVMAGVLFRFAASPNYLAGSQWRSGEAHFYRPMAPAVANVNAESYPVTLKVFGDGVLRFTKVVANQNPFRVTGGYRARDIEIDLSELSGKVNAVSLASAMEELI